MTIVPTEDEGPGSGSGSGAASNSIAANDNQVVLNTGGDQYQTVTIVPSDGNTGEVSYVLIVQQPEDKDKGGGHGGAGSDEAIGVYDFENENEFEDGDDDEAIDDKSKIRKIKPSQQV